MAAVQLELERFGLVLLQHVQTRVYMAGAT